MKYAALILLFGWSVHILYNIPNLKPSDNYPLWILGAFTMLYTVAGIVILIHDRNKPPHYEHKR